MEWALRKNIERHEKLIEKETDPQKRRVMQQLLHEERTKLAMLKVGEPKADCTASR